jgi:GMP synthase (glutamine-hydrolysing)
MTQDNILVLDFGGQYTQLIAKSVRSCNVFSKILPHNTSLEKILEQKPKGIVLSGGPDSVYEEDAPTLSDIALFDHGIPILGICYGMQYINHVFGGETLSGDNILGEYGQTKILTSNTHPLFLNLHPEIITWMSHGDSVDINNLTNGFRVIANSKNHIAAITNDEKQIYGVQFHPEVTHTLNGLDIISNFVHNICGCDYSWTMKNYAPQSIAYTKNTVGKNNVINFMSGGVDSSAVGKIIELAKLPGQVHHVYIGALMRKGEDEQVLNSLKQTGLNVMYVPAQDRFIGAIKNLSHPEDKRKTIGNMFGTIMQETCIQLGLDPNNTMLAQGTLYTDLIESGKGVGKKAVVIKSHHNVGCEFIDNLQAKNFVVEPNKELVKYEVRILAREIGLPEPICSRLPFPGPGGGIRIIDGIRKGRLDINYDQELARMDETEYKINALTDKKSFTDYVLPIKTVGVQGDGPTYTYTALLHGVNNWDNIREATSIIPGQIKNINRIVYLIGEDIIDPSIFTRGLECRVTNETFGLWQEIDSVGRNLLTQHDLYLHIDQDIFTLFGADISNNNQLSVGVRLVNTTDFKTVTPVNPDKVNALWPYLHELKDTLTKKFPIGAVVYDVTDKPPATTCWE